MAVKREPRPGPSPSSLLILQNPPGQKTFTNTNNNTYSYRLRYKYHYDDKKIDNHQLPISSPYNTCCTRLPIVDIRVKDIGKARQAFKVEVGRVCFS